MTNFQMQTIFYTLKTLKLFPLLFGHPLFIFLLYPLSSYYLLLQSFYSSFFPSLLIHNCLFVLPLDDIAPSYVRPSYCLDTQHYFRSYFYAFTIYYANFCWIQNNMINFLVGNLVFAGQSFSLHFDVWSTFFFGACWNENGN